MSAEIYGLILAGGQSRRMGENKALIEVHGKPQALVAHELLQPFTGNTYLSCQAGQYDGTPCEPLPQLHDRPPAQGPLGGLARAFEEHPEAAWLVVACDLPLLTANTVSQLISSRDPAKKATAFLSSSDGMPEPMCAIFEPGILPELQKRLAEGRRCARWMLVDLAEEVCLLQLPETHALDNANTPEDLTRIKQQNA